MSEYNFDSFIVNSMANATANSSVIFESYLESREQLKLLPSHLRKDEETVLINLFKEVYFQKTHKSLFRKSQSSNDVLINFWLGKVKRIANLYCGFNEIRDFNGLSKSDIVDIASGNPDPYYIKKLEKILLERGIIFVVEPNISGIKLDGAVFRLDSGHPVVAMSLRYKRLDNFWFTLMHELSHIVLHYDQLDSYIIDDLDYISEDLIELEADKLATNSLIPRNIWRTCLARRDLSEQSVRSFAIENGVHPAIVAGRIQHELNDYRKLSSLTNAVNVREILFSE